MKEFKGHKIHTLVETEYGKRVDCKLYHHGNTDNVYWSPRWEGSGGAHGGLNSYVLVEAGYDEYVERNCGLEIVKKGRKSTEVFLACINGAGEVRWWVTARELDYELETECKGTFSNNGERGERLKAARYFGLVEYKWLSLVGGTGYKYSKQPLRIIKKVVVDLFHGVGADMGIEDISDPGFRDYAADTLCDAGVPDALIDEVLDEVGCKTA